MFTKISLGDTLLSPPENSIYGLMEISDKRQNNETDTTMENNNNLTQEDEREKLLRELSVKAENLRIKYSELSPAEEKEMVGVLVLEGDVLDLVVTSQDAFQTVTNAEEVPDAATEFLAVDGAANLTHAQGEEV